MEMNLKVIRQGMGMGRNVALCLHFAALALLAAECDAEPLPVAVRPLGRQAFERCEEGAEIRLQAVGSDAVVSVPVETRLKVNDAPGDYRVSCRDRASGIVRCATVKRKVLDVCACGAKGDGATKDTKAIQSAIDAVARTGGGTVRIGAGTYLTGSLFLKSNVELFLDCDATLKGSPDKEDYNAVDVCPQNWSSRAESASGAHLLLCIEQTNVTVCGTGRIDGNCTAFLLDAAGKPWPGGQGGIPWRPSQMLYFVESDNVRVEGVSLVDSPYWSCFFHGCTHVAARRRGAA